MMFSPELILAHLEALRMPNGAFIASPASDYRALWVRDQLYMAICYWYLARFYPERRDEFHEKLRQSVQLVFNIFHAQRHKLERVNQPRDHEGKLIVAELVNAKYDAETLRELTRNWGHHQLDMIGLFLYLVADLKFKNIVVARDRGDHEILQLLVFYLENVRYWQEPDNGIWEECLICRSSSIGAVVAGLDTAKRQELATVPEELITLGRNKLRRILPYESQDQCGAPFHYHDCDAAQLFLIWPFHVVTKETADVILSRIIDGHVAPDGTPHKLVQPMGINRYYGDNYRRSRDGVSAQWQWEWLLSIIFSLRNEYEQAVFWFLRTAGRITPEGYITEAFTDGKPNDHTPLGWMHALALIAYEKLPPEFREKVVAA